MQPYPKWKRRYRALLVTLAISITHFIIGNLIGIYTDGTGVIGYLFLPYTFIAGMSTYAGWDNAAVVVDFFALIIMTVFFYPIGMFLVEETRS